jgi:acetyl esterase
MGGTHRHREVGMAPAKVIARTVPLSSRFPFAESKAQCSRETASVALVQSSSMPKAVFIFAIGLLAALPALSLEEKDVAYGSRDGKALLLDLHVPEGPGPFPAAILIHGGGFDGGSKSTNVRPLFEPLANAGIAWFSLDYRLAPTVQFPQALRDIDDGIVWVKTNASKYRIDPSRIAIIGESAGGFFVNYIGTHQAAKVPVAAVVDFYGPSDYGQLAQLRNAHPERFDMTTINRHAANGGGIRFFGVQQLDQSGLAKLHALAPIVAVHKGMPPFLCIHGTKDDQVSYEQSIAFCDAIRRVGTNCELITIEGGGHGMSHWREPDMQHWKPEMITWLKKTLQIQ